MNKKFTITIGPETQALLTELEGYYRTQTPFELTKETIIRAATQKGLASLALQTKAKAKIPPTCAY